MSAETDPEIQQDPGIPGSKTPDQLPPQDEPEIERVPDADQPDYDEEGSRSAEGRALIHPGPRSQGQWSRLPEKP